jgi:hypothetical protein
MKIKSNCELEIVWAGGRKVNARSVARKLPIPNVKGELKGHRREKERRLARALPGDGYQIIETKISRVVVAPLPVIALLVLVERFEVAIVLVPAIPVGVVNDDFVVVPTVIVVMVLIIITDRSRAADARRGRQSNGREGQQRRTALQSSHNVNLLLILFLKVK